MAAVRIDKDIFLSTLPTWQLAVASAVLREKGNFTATEKWVLVLIDQEIMHRRNLQEDL